jgi:2-phosphoglycerate kinase
MMARALIAVGVPADAAYQLARRIELDLAERGERALDIDRLHVLASGPSGGCAVSLTCRASMSRSS